MFSDVGKLSFWINIVFILASLIFIYSIIMNNSIEKEKLDKIIDLGKWFFVSVAIVLSTSIVSDGFRERDEDLKEAEFFDKYANTIIQTDEIEKIWLLSEFLATVSPEGAMRDSWEDYKTNIVKPKHDRYLEVNKAIPERKKEIAERSNKADPTPEEQQQTKELEQEIIKLEQEKISLNNQSLVSKGVQEEWAIIAGSDKTPGEGGAGDELKKFDKKYPAAIYKKGSWFVTIVGPFLVREEALMALPEIKNKNPSSRLLGDFQSWCRNSEKKDDYIQCN